MAKKKQEDSVLKRWLDVAGDIDLWLDGDKFDDYIVILARATDDNAFEFDYRVKTSNPGAFERHLDGACEAIDALRARPQHPEPEDGSEGEE